MLILRDAGTVPSFRTNKQLVYLQLSYNQLNGRSASRAAHLAPNSHFCEFHSIPQFDLPELQYLELAGAQLSGSMPSFRGTPRLQTLVLDENALTGTANLTHLRQLRTLSVRRNPLLAIVLDQLMPALQVSAVLLLNLLSALSDGLLILPAALS